MKEIWEAASKSDKAIYVIAILLGVPLAICWDKYEKNNLFVVWHLFITPFFVAIALIILKGWVIGVFSTNKDSDQKENSIGFPLILFLIGMTFKNSTVILISISVAAISLITWIKVKNT